MNDLDDLSDNTHVLPFDRPIQKVGNSAHSCTLGLRLLSDFVLRCLMESGDFERKVMKNLVFEETRSVFMLCFGRLVFAFGDRTILERAVSWKTANKTKQEHLSHRTMATTTQTLFVVLLPLSFLHFYILTTSKLPLNLITASFFLLFVLSPSLPPSLLPAPV
ncbi:hypothetical protein L596_014518 [Steinernema carpocapsae]|uniref:Uncharacterized protein n=1 Tax=Steinernema carpocapsae TaxID=34508 RepID=A0A4U5NCP6_STECR|nr:hypothetical protein L596_014518 [Steinernema carpocapsae]